MPEQDFAGLVPGLSIEERNARLDASVVLSARPEVPMPAELKEYSTTADPTTRTFSATFSFEAAAGISVLPGMTAKLVVRGPRETGAGGAGQLIPASAVAEDVEGTPYVWRVDRPTMQVVKALVTLGELTGASVLVTHGLESGDWIVTSGVHQLRESMEVRRLSE